MLNKFTKKLNFRFLTALTAVTLVLVIGVISVSAMFDTSGFEVLVTEINNFENKNSTKKIKTKETTLSDFLAEQNYEIGAHDRLNLDDNSPINENTEIVITRGVPFSIEADGHIIFCSTTKTTVGEALLETGHYPNEDDILTPDLNAPLTPSLNILITRVDSKTVIITEPVPNTTEYKEDNTLEKGKTKVIKEGHQGSCDVTVNIVYNNGVEVSRTEISRVVTKEPENKVIANGTKEVAKKSTSKKSAATQTLSSKNTTAKSDTNAAGTVAGLKYTKKYTMSATGYTAFRSDGSRGKTASGRAAGYGLVAVDPKVIPLGTRLYIEGYGEAIAADTGGAIKGNKIDLCFEQSNAWIRKEFGRKTLKVYVLE